MIVALEGIDASGKATQTEAIRNSIASGRPGFDVRKHDFPHYKTIAGGVVGRILRGELIVAPSAEFHDRRDGDLVSDLRKSWSLDKAVIIQSVMVADRLEWLPLLIQYAQSPDNLLILDRYKYSGFAYGVADGLNADFMDTIQGCLPDADLNILLDISVDESKRRRPERRDYYETNFSKLEKVRNLYLEEFKSRSANTDSDDFPECMVFDGMKSQDEISNTAVDVILTKLRALSAWI